MKKITLLFILLYLFSSNFYSQEKSLKDKIVDFFYTKDSLITKSYKINKGFSYSYKKINENINLKQINFIKKENGSVKNIIGLYSNSSTKKFEVSEYFFSNGNIFIIDEDKKLFVFNTSLQKQSSIEYNLILHVLKFSKIVNDKIEKFFIAKSCYVKVKREDDSYESDNIIFNDFLNSNEKQLILKGEKFIYVYKIKTNKDNNIEINLDYEKIFRFQLSNHSNPFKKSVIESIKLYDKLNAIEKFDNEYLNFDYDFSEKTFRWDANNVEQIYSLRKVGILNKILDEI